MKTGLLSEHYRMDGIKIVREIGRGSYGSVWLVRRSNNQRNLILKCVELSHCDQQKVEAARQEVLILAGLKHPNIVSYKGSFELDHRLHLLMGYCEGGDLYTRIQQQHGSLFPEKQIIRWFIQITMALQYLHLHNILHRDLKTQNIFLTRSGLIKLGDFGIARILGSSIDMATTMIGTPYYMSPEIYAGLPYNYKSDVWALGCCLYELSTLKHAFPARDMSTLIYRISRGKIGGVSNHYSEDLKCLVQSLMNRSPDLRPSASQILHQSFIQNHISVFLNDTTIPSNATNRAERHQVVIEHKKSGESGFKEKECVIAHDCEKTRTHFQSDKMLTENRNEKLNDPVKCRLSARRCCEFLPTEFDSLHIAGDKMKLEDRSRVETKSNRKKDCMCKQHEKQVLPAAGHIGSQSRRRRRSNIKCSVEEKEEDEGNNLPSNPDEFSSVKSGVDSRLSAPNTCSARERRRLKRLQEYERNCFKTVVQHKQLRNEQECMDGNDSAQSDDSSSLSPDNHVAESSNPCDTDVSSSVYDTLGEKLQEEDEFRHLLSTTLSEDSTFNSDEVDICTENRPIGDGVGLDARVSLLEEALVKEVGEDMAETVIRLLKPETMEDWYEQRLAVQQLLGDELFSSVSTTVWHLKLCYTLG
ncbi:uncharacterized protein [Panulirus ornatus]